MLRGDISQINETLELIINEDTNTKLTTQTFNKDVCALCNNINAILDNRRKSNIEHERANAAFKQAITNISHDIRTPLTSAIGYLQMLRGENITPQKQAEYLEIIENRLLSLSNQMGSLFDFAKIIEGKTALDIKAADICKTLREAITECYAELEMKKFKVEVNIPDKPVYLMYDENSLCRILQNLLKNVCEHGREFLRISVIEGEAKSAIEIANKADLSAVDTSRIFERFYTADVSRTSKNSGLGLAIARELTERMGGGISATADGGMLVVRLELKNGL